MNSVEEGEREPQGEDELGHLDLCPVDDCSDDREDVEEEELDDDNHDYVVRWNVEKWIKLNYDSGAVSTVVPVEMVENDVKLEKVGDFRRQDSQVRPCPSSRRR